MNKHFELEEQHHILRVITEYVEELGWTPTRWDAMNFCIGYFGAVDKTHIEVINYLYRQRVLFS